MDIFTQRHWKKARAGYMNQARLCKETLTDPLGHWRLDAGDERVKMAVQCWIDRARRAHAIALGRVALMENAVLVCNGAAVRGSVFVERAANSNTEGESLLNILNLSTFNQFLNELTEPKQ